MLQSSRFKVYLFLSAVLCTALLLLLYHKRVSPVRWSPSNVVTMLHSGNPSCPDCDHPTELESFRPSKVQYVHQSWKTRKLPPRFERWSATWKKCFPKAKYILWTDVDNRNFIKKHYPWFLKRYDILPSNIHRADAVRYLYLFHYGGIYSDLDNECLHPFDHLLLNATIVLGAMDGHSNVKEGFVQNSFMYSAPRHPMWMEVILDILTAKKLNEAPETLTGPWALVRAVNAYRKRRNSTADVTVYPPHYFNPFSWQRNKVKACKHFNYMSDEEMIECRNKFLNSSYVVQYHTHTWGGGRIL